MMLMLFNWFLFSVPLSCLAFIPDNTEKLTSVIGELTERIADLEVRLSTQEHININLESRLKVQEKKNREHEDLINALSARTCTTSKQSAFKRQQDEMLHKNSFNNRVAFYSYLSNTDMHPKPNQTIVFDHVVTNTGGKFNSKTGVFTCPTQGVYAFSWTVYCSNGGYLISELVVNSRSVGDMLCSGQGDDNIRHTSSVAVVELNEGDRVYVRTHPIAVLNGVLWSGPTYLSSFSGWTIF
ncbi:complement C1q-like protein 4 isoform X2 [Crassostrea angulata]|uniref:complement C1q-like protein 4 isoform X2 n=1 Tax=Magallana angulata TaxID=2784310 RepID=UPI0022B0B742|nr:complement C1q-like protein 4 isoform X2 [Crassostrea angulata]